MPLVYSNLTTLNERMEGSVNDSISNLRPLNILLKYLYETQTLVLLTVYTEISS